MNLVVISGSAWTEYQGAAQALLARVALAGHTDTLLLDYDTVRREAAGAPAPAPAVQWPGLVPFAHWMKDARLADEQINPQAILSTAQQIGSEHMVVLDARHYGAPLIEAALAKARLAWYPLDQWHPTFALVCDDAWLLRLVSVLATTFYSQPQVLSERETRLLVRAVMRRAFVYRWMGARVGRFSRSLSRLLERYKAAQDRLGERMSAGPRA